MGSKEVKPFLFVGDIVVWVENEREVQKPINKWNQENEEYRKQISVVKSKTSVMTRGEREGRNNITIIGKPLEVVKALYIWWVLSLKMEI